MAKLPSLEHVKYVRAKGRVYAYFNTGRKADGKPVYARLPDPADPAFFAAYAAHKAKRAQQAVKAYTVASLCREYLASPKFARVSAGTQKTYRVTIKRIESLLGDFPADDLQPGDIQTVLDNIVTTPGAQHIFVAVLGALYRWKFGRRAARPTDDLEKPKYGEHDPWSEAILEAGLKAEHDRTRLAIHLLYFTGQRIGDVCAMRWTDLAGGRVSISQQKTGKLVEFPIAQELRAELDRTPKRGLTILTNHKGAAISTEIVRKELKRFAASMGRELVPHGLRKNAVNALLEAGCSIAETAAITGQTYQMVERYARKINRRRLGETAVLKWEQKRAGKTV